MMTESPIDVLVIGRSCRDTIAVVDRFPAENTKVPLTRKLVEGGGQGSTAACCIARLGGRVAYIGVLGDDPAGAFCRRRLEDFGVETDFVRTVPGGRTPEAFVIITRPSGDRTIVYEKNELPRLTADDIPAFPLETGKDGPPRPGNHLSGPGFPRPERPAGVGL